MAEPPPALQLHLEPNEPIEVALARQYQTFVEADERLGKPKDARLLVSSVAPGSIDISLIPDWSAAAGLLVPLGEHIQHVTKFAEHIKALIKLFAGEKATKPSEVTTVKDCDDAINIVKPVANHGGSQVFNVINGPVTITPILITDAVEARRVVENATREKARLQYPAAERKERVSMVWTRLDRQKAKVAGSSPDQARIDEIDPKQHPVFLRTI